MTRSTELGIPATNVKQSSSKASINEDLYLGPVPKRDLTTRERIILMEGSKLNGYIFPPWTSVTSSNFDGPTYKEDGELSLSRVQLEVFDGWRRAVDMAVISGGSQMETPTMMAEKAIDLVQDVTTDCSVVASLCAVSARLTADRSDVREKSRPHRSSTPG